MSPFGRLLPLPLRPLALSIGIVLSLHAQADALPSPLALFGDVVTGIAAPHVPDVGAPRWKAAAPATTNVVVTNCHDAGNGSLRDAMINSVEYETVDLTQLTCSRITLTSGALTTNQTTNVITLYANHTYTGGVIGPGVTIDANGTSRAIIFLGHSNINLYGLAIENGLASFSGATGGCITSNSTVNLTFSTVTGCHVHAPGSSTGLGGAIYSTHDVNLIFSTVSGNTVTSDTGYAYGGGIFSRGAVNMDYSTVDGNTAAGGNGNGYAGGIAAANVNIYTSTVSNNVATYDAAMDLSGNTQSRFTDSTISGNVAHGGIGGIQARGPLYAIDTTIANNNSEATLHRASGIFIDGNTITAYGTIIANNTDGTRAADVGGSHAVVGSADLIMAADVGVPTDTIRLDPRLGTLANNGGLTHTRALLAGSPAIDVGTTNIRIFFDQRGGRFPRQVGPAPDIGAFEASEELIFANGFE